MTPSPEPESRRRRLSPDELLAIVIAFASIGAVFAWSVTRGDQGWNWPILAESPSPSPVAASPSLPPSPAPTPSSAAIAPGAPTSTPLPTAPPPAPSPRVAPYFAPVPVPAPSEAPAPAASPAPSAQPKQFADVPAGFWASAPIAALSARGILGGFPDGKFYPNKPITRAEFAEMLQKAFNQSGDRAPLKFSDVAANYWASGAIDEATRTKFMSGFPDGTFQPNREIPRVQMLLALATGLNLKPQSPPNQVLNRYEDAGQIPKYAIDKVAGATEAGLVLNDATPKRLGPNQVATRADAAALIYEALQK